MTPPLIIIVTEDRALTGEEYVRRHLAGLCDAHLTCILNAASLLCLREPEDPTTWIVARAAEDEYTRRGLYP